MSKQHYLNLQKKIALQQERNLEAEMIIIREGFKLLHKYLDKNKSTYTKTIVLSGKEVELTLPGSAIRRVVMMKFQRVVAGKRVRKKSW